MADIAVVNALELVTCSGEGPEGLGIVQDGAMLVEGGKVAWVGTTSELRKKSVKASREVDAAGSLVTPGFVDPHTHLLFAGSREDEMERKIAGESYTDILKSGGGILRTVRETRKAPIAELVDQSLQRVRQLARGGATTIEVKTGYGLNTETEARMLEAMRRLAEASGVEIVSTFMGLHATPPEFKSSTEFTDHVVEAVLPYIAGMKEKPEFADCFCEEGVFTDSDCERFLKAAKALGFRLKVHADEFKESGGATLAARAGCVSADHLGKASASGVEAMAKAGVTAVLLPGTSLFSGIPYAHYGAVKEAGCNVALGTDLSPNSWLESTQLVMALGCTELRMTPAEALKAVTVGAARALGRNDIGSLKVGAKADFVIHSLPGYRFLPYRVGGAYVNRVFKRGSELYASSSP